MIFDPTYIIFVALPSLALAIWAQAKVKGAFHKYSKVRASSGLTGAEAARYMLDQAGLPAVRVERVQGFLSDHYDPRHKVLRLSPEVHDARSIAAIGVACHEAGHAIQDARNYKPLVIRNAIVPTAGIGSNLGVYLVMIGLILNYSGLAFGITMAWVGVILFGSVVVFQLVNLPVEFNASSRAKEMIGQLALVSGPQEMRGIESVLGAAAMTYVAATIGAVLQLLYYVMLLVGGRRD